MDRIVLDPDNAHLSADKWAAVSPVNAMYFFLVYLQCVSKRSPNCNPSLEMIPAGCFILPNDTLNQKEVDLLWKTYHQILGSSARFSSLEVKTIVDLCVPAEIPLPFVVRCLHATPDATNCSWFVPVTETKSEYVSAMSVNESLSASVRRMFNKPLTPRLGRMPTASSQVSTAEQTMQKLVLVRNAIVEFSPNTIGEHMSLFTEIILNILVEYCNANKGDSLSLLNFLENNFNL